ncbi:hypothetical protein F5878DRAFT_659978 [Lentinula raphanica]|uniref:Uncharacterized protein n=1 Tax=Lentinula raphanica TaxID=153919 RepID=A0AA38PBU5_9AGAR|nr:hypothetical protein F5878DRAFT_659978 [Lentinula raphanica]
MRSKFMNLFLGLSLLMVSTWAIPVGQPVQASAGHVTDANTSESKSTSSEKLYKPVQGSAGHVTDAMRPSKSTEKLYFSSKREWTARDIECVKIGVHFVAESRKGKNWGFPEKFELVELGDSNIRQDKAFGLADGFVYPNENAAYSDRLGPINVLGSDSEPSKKLFAMLSSKVFKPGFGFRNVQDSVTIGKEDSEMVFDENEEGKMVLIKNPKLKVEKPDDDEWVHVTSSDLEPTN